MIKFFSKPKSVLLPGLCCSLLLLSACATTLQKEDSVEKRAIARWDALLSDDIAVAYEYLSPGFRSSVTMMQYQKSLLLKKVRWTEANYIESECTEKICKVRILLTYTIYGALVGVKSFSGNESIEESWIKSANEWYLVPAQ